MPRRLLADDAWAVLLDPPADEREVARLYTLTDVDLAAVGKRRTDATRLGCALVLLYLRHPGRVLKVGEVPPGPLLTYVARQLGANASAFGAYTAARATTRREHLAEVAAAGGYRDRPEFGFSLTLMLVANSKLSVCSRASGSGKARFAGSEAGCCSPWASLRASWVDSPPASK